MSKIITVSGETENLGFTHCHEHLCIEKGRSFEINSALCIDEPNQTLKELFDFKQAGGNSVADAQPIGCGRNPLVLKSLSEESGVHVIACTGFHKRIFYPENHWIFSCGAQRLAEIFESELETGMFTNCDNSAPAVQTDIRAGFIKTALDGNHTLDDHEQKMYTAAAIASIRTGAKIMVHIERGANPIELADFLNSRGIAFGSMIFCHADRAVPSPDIHKALLSRGAFLEYDTIGRFKYHSDEDEAKIILNMLNAGFEDQILLSLDVTRQRLIHYGGEIGLCYLIKSFIPLLKAFGVHTEQIHKICSVNPDKAFRVHSVSQ